MHQGCILSPYIFNLYTASITRKAGIETLQEIAIGRRMINNLKYADDITLITGNLDLKILINTVKQISEGAGLRLNIKKTKVMTTVGLQEFKLKDDHVKIVLNFNFLGSIIRDDADCAAPINSRLNVVVRSGMWKRKLEAVIFLWERKREKSTASAST